MRMGLGLGLGSGSALFNPAILFANGEQGAWYDPSDLTTMFQDAAGTTPCAVDAVVGLIRDKSGRGNHASQSTTASKPILRQSGSLYYLEFDGVDDYFSTSSIDFSATDKMTVWDGTRSTNNNFQCLAELSATVSTNNGSFAISNGSAVLGGNRLGVQLRGTSLLGEDTPANFAKPVTFVRSHAFDIAGATPAAEIAIRVNGAGQALSTAGGDGIAGTGNFGNYSLFIGRRNGASIAFNGYLYGLVIRGVASTATLIDRTERFLSNKTGIVW